MEKVPQGLEWAMPGKNGESYEEIINVIFVVVGTALYECFFYND